MTTWVVLPIKDPAQAKSRLAPAVQPQVRRAAALALAGRTLAVLSAAGGLDVVVVTRGTVVPPLVAEHGWPCLAETGASHTSAARQGATWAAARGATVVLALAADLPLLLPADVEAALRRAGPDRVVIAPDRLGLGTNAVAAPPNFPFTFGAPSFARHVQLARALGLTAIALRTPGLAVDLDSAWDMDLLDGPLQAGGARLQSVGRSGTATAGGQHG